MWTVSHTWRIGAPIECSATRPVSRRCANMTAPGRATLSLSGGCGFRCGWFRTPGGSGHQLVITDRKTYGGRPFCVANGLRHAIGTGNTLLVYQPSYILRLVQGMAFRGTNQAISGVWYRGWPSGVPTEGGTIVGTEKPPQEYND